MHPGGIADKVGNRFEARWLIYQLVGLLDARARSITVEMLGDDDHGFEFFVDRGTTVEWHQCKRQTPSGRWSVSSLARADVLPNFLRKLGAGPEMRCVFVSTDGAVLKGLGEKRPAAANIPRFEASLSDREQDIWQSLQAAAGNARDAFDLLDRTQFRTLAEADLVEMVEERLGYFFAEDPEQLIARFRDWVEQDENFNRALRFDDLMAFADRTGLKLRQHALDSTLPQRLRQATSNYTGSYPPLGAGLFQIARPEAGAAWQALEDGARVVITAGGPGSGKSAILKDLVARLVSQQTPHLGFRVDWAEGVTTVADLGEHLIGEADNPAIILEQLAGRDRAVLLIDQADAVSQMSGRVGALRSVVLDLVRRAQRYDHVQIVFACRTFDLDNDHAYRDIAAHPLSTRIDVAGFNQEQVEGVLNDLGISADLRSAKLLSLLCTPIGLTLAAELARSGFKDLRQIEQLSQLYARLLELRDREISHAFRPPWSLMAVLSALATDMSRREALTAPVMLVDQYPGASDILQRTGTIQLQGNRVSLFHESLFDFLHARAFVQAGEQLTDWLLGSEQTLFRRTQTRQILSFLRDLDRPRYLKDLEFVLLAPRVRAHVRHTVVRWLGTLADPTLAEWKLLERFAASEGLPRRTGYVLYEHTAWFDLVHGEGLVARWLDEPGEHIQWVLGLLRSIASMRPAEVATLIRTLYARHPKRLPDILSALRWIDTGLADPAPLADCIVEILGDSTPEDWEQGETGWSDYYSGWIKAAPEHAARILAAQYRRSLRLHPEGHPFDRHADTGDRLFHISELAERAPYAFLEAILPAMHEAMRRTRQEGKVPAEDGIWHWRPSNEDADGVVYLIDIVRAALARAAQDRPDDTAALLSAMEPHLHETALHLLLETVAANGEQLHGLLLGELDNPGLFEAGWYLADAHSAARAMASAFPYLSGEDRTRCEALVLTLWPERDYLAETLKRHGISATTIPEPSDYTRHILEQNGRRQWSVLRLIGPEQLSPIASARLAMFERKFSKVGPELPEGVHFSAIASPIALLQAERMSDAAWLRAIAKMSTPERRQRDWRSHRGGAEELARVLREVVKKAPSRFLALLPWLPQGVHTSFPQAIVGGIADSKPSATQVEQVFETVTNNSSIAVDSRELMWLLRACDEALGPHAEAYLADVACKGDDESGVEGISRNNKDREQPDWKQALDQGGDLHIKAINAPRGIALALAGVQAWNSPERFKRYRMLLGNSIGAHTAPHIHAAFDRLVLSALKHDFACGVDWTLRIARVAPEALYAGHGQRILGWIGEHDTAAFAELAQIFLTHVDPRARAFGTLIVAQRALDDKDWDPLVEKLLDSGRQYRAAIAAVATANFTGARFGSTASSWLIRFFDDEDALVRAEASDCFRRMGANGIRTHAGLFEAYVASRYFTTDANYFLFQLKDASADLDEVTLGLLEKAMTPDATEQRRHGLDLHYAADLLLRIYTSNLDKPQRIARTLNLIDTLVELGLLEPAKLDNG